MKCLGVDISRPLFKFLTSLSRQPPLVMPYNGCQRRIAEMSSLRVALGKELDQPSLPQFLDELGTWAAGLSQVVQGCHEVPPASIVASLSNVVKRCGMYSAEAEAGLRQMEQSLSEQYCEQKENERAHAWDAMLTAKVEVVEESSNSTLQGAREPPPPPPSSQTWVLYHQRTEGMGDSEKAAEACTAQANQGQRRAAPMLPLQPDLKRPATLAALMNKCQLLPQAAQVQPAEAALTPQPSFSSGGHGRRGKGSCGKPGQRLTLADLESQFGVVLKQAAKNLNVCPTTLKRACRRHGVGRWPRQDLMENTAIAGPIGSEGAASRNDSLDGVEQMLSSGIAQEAAPLLASPAQGVGPMAMDADSDGEAATMLANGSLDCLGDFDLDLELAEAIEEPHAFELDALQPKAPEPAQAGTVAGAYGCPPSPDMAGVLADFLMADDLLPNTPAPVGLAEGGVSVPGSAFLNSVQATAVGDAGPMDAGSGHCGTAYSQFMRGLPELLQEELPAGMGMNVGMGSMGSSPDLSQAAVQRPVGLLATNHFSTDPLVFKNLHAQPSNLPTDAAAAAYTSGPDMPWWLHQSPSAYTVDDGAEFTWQPKLGGQGKGLLAAGLRGGNKMDLSAEEKPGCAAGYLEMLLDSENANRFDGSWRSMAA